MSMFKKMKERITDEVNSATNKLQNMQLIDQLSSSIGQQITTPNQLLPEPQASQSQAAFCKKTADKRQFSLLDDGPICGYNEEEELNNSDISPQHQLFNETTIKRLNMTNGQTADGISNGQASINNFSNNNETQTVQSQSVINIQELSSDIEDGDDENSKEDDIEIDLLSDKSMPSDQIKNMSNEHLLQYKSRYRSMVHAFKNMHSEFKAKEEELENGRRKLLNRISVLETTLDNAKLLNNKSDSTPSAPSTASTSPQPNYKSTSSKVKDLERILAKCKESLKLKNSQIKSLKVSLGEVEKFGELNQELKCELNSLREAHETWTISIAENKRVMHQEIEKKNMEMEKLRGEISELQNKLIDGNNKIRQFKSTIQDLESRLVSTSAAHQKERESLTKELTSVKNNAIRQLQKEHELQLERVKLDLEKSIECLKQELLTKDELIIKNSLQYQQVHDKNLTLTTELEELNRKLTDQQKSLDEVNQRLDEEMKKSSGLLAEIEEFHNQTKACEADEIKASELKTELDTTKEQLKSALIAKDELGSLIAALRNEDKPSQCEQCEKLRTENLLNRELFQQELHEINARLELMTTANYDQEKEVKSLELESQSMRQSYNQLRSEYDELLKKNESLARVLRENEIDMQAHQDQIDNLKTIEQQLETLRKENVTLSESLDAVRTELSDKNADLTQLKNQFGDLNNELVVIKKELDNTQKVAGDLKRERDSFASLNESLVKQKRQHNEKLVIKILAVMKNLETPTTSPGSDKSFESIQKAESDSDNCKELPDTVNLMDELLSLALDRSNSHLTATQRLQAVQLENSMISEEVKRLKEELNNLNREKTLETQHSIEEAEKLRIENQALIQDQQSYDDRLAQLEEQIQILTEELTDKTNTIAAAASDEQEESVPTSTEFEYLKNIVYQFMLGKEPLVLARVISAIFKFDKSQVEQICRVQESIHSSSRPTL